VYVYTWERGEKRNINDNYIHIYFPFIKNKVNNFIKYVLFIVWVPYKILLNVKCNDVIIFMDLETIVLGFVTAKLKKAVIIWDIVDPFCEAKNINCYLIKKIIQYIEFLFMKIADIVIVPHKCRIDYYYDEINKKIDTDNLIVIENVFDPRIFSFEDINKINNKSKIEKLNKFINSNKNRLILIGYFGRIDSRKGLKYLLNLAIKYPDFIGLVIAGKNINDVGINFYTKIFNNIFYWGEFSQIELPILYKYIDFIWAYYSPEIKLHKYAAPNKYYEHLYFKKPIITSRVMPQSEEISRMNSGIILDKLEESKDFMDKLIIEMERLKRSNIYQSINKLQKTYLNYYDEKSKELIWMIKSAKKRNKISD